MSGEWSRREGESWKPVREGEIYGDIDDEELPGLAGTWEMSKPGLTYCWSHRRYEDCLELSREGNDGHWCGECGHVFLSSEDLLRDHNVVLREINLSGLIGKYPPPGNYSVGKGFVPLKMETDVNRVYSCPHCIHDF